MKEEQGIDAQEVLKNSKTYECQDCSGKTFMPIYELKIVPKSMSPSGQESILPTEAGFVCISCGTVVGQNNSDSQNNSKVIQTDE